MKGESKKEEGISTYKPILFSHFLNLVLIFLFSVAQTSLI